MVMEVLKAREAATHGSLDGSEGTDDISAEIQTAEETIAESGVTV